jgi:hypothetical protein
VSLPTYCNAGHCTACGRLIWRTATAARDRDGVRAGQLFLLWPLPESVYARLATDTGSAPGVAFCLSCIPRLGERALEGFGPVMGLDTAHSRYSDWFSEGRDIFYRAWLSEVLSLEPLQIEVLMAQWAQDRG